MVEKERNDYGVFNVNVEEELMKEVEAIDPNAFHNMTDAMLQKVVLATSQDGNHKTLADMISYGRHDDKTQVPPNVHDYWAYRDELAAQDGIIY